MLLRYLSLLAKKQANAAAGRLCGFHSTAGEMLKSQGQALTHKHTSLILRAQDLQQRHLYGDLNSIPAWSGERAGTQASPSLGPHTAPKDTSGRTRMFLVGQREDLRPLSPHSVAPSCSSMQVLQKAGN